MKKILLVIFTIICGVAFSEGFAKKPTKREMIKEKSSAKIDSIKQELEKRKKEQEFDEMITKGGGWDRAAKFTDYYCLADYLYKLEEAYQEDSGFDNLLEDQEEYRYKLYTLCSDYGEKNHNAESIVAYTIQENEKDSVLCQQKAKSSADNIIYEIISRRLSPLHTLGNIFLKPKDTGEEISCDQLWKTDLIELPSKPEGLRLYERAWIKQLPDLIHHHSLVCDTVVKVEDEYRCYLVEEMPIEPIYQWLETFVKTEENELWKEVFYELLYHPTTDSRVVVGINNYYL